MKTPGIFTRKEPYDERAYMTIGEKQKNQDFIGNLIEL